MLPAFVAGLAAVVLVVLIGALLTAHDPPHTSTAGGNSTAPPLSRDATGTAYAQSADNEPSPLCTDARGVDTSTFWSAFGQPPGGGQESRLLNITSEAKFAGGTAYLCGADGTEFLLQNQTINGGAQLQLRFTRYEDVSGSQNHYRNRYQFSLTGFTHATMVALVDQCTITIDQDNHYRLQPDPPIETPATVTAALSATPGGPTATPLPAITGTAPITSGAFTFAVTFDGQKTIVAINGRNLPPLTPLDTVQSSAIQLILYFSVVDSTRVTLKMKNFQFTSPS